jgi:hypothetical protein
LLSGNQQVSSLLFPQSAGHELSGELSSMLATRHHTPGLGNQPSAAGNQHRHSDLMNTLMLRELLQMRQGQQNENNGNN